MSDVAARLSTALADRYRIERELGQGGMATVYLAHDLKHVRDVAIKVLHPDLGAALGSERFLSEIRTTARLQHPHILPLLDSGEADGLLYYVMPLVTGETLRSRIQREHQLSIPEAIRIAREVASALDYAHRHDVIHRDIKPENVLLHDGSALVADFGIALAVHQAGGQRMTQTGLSLGTPQYMSPEQAMGERVIDARSDVYALGALTYEMLAGEPPFTGPTVQAIVAKVLNSEPVPVTSLRKSVPPNVAAAVAKSLEKLPADRFEGARAFGEALHDPTFRTDARTNGGMPRATRALSSRMAVGSLAVAVAVLVSVGWLAYRRESAPSSQPVQFVVTANGVAEPVYTLTWPATVSPDGRTILYAGAAGNGTYQYYLRDVGRLGARPIAGTIEAQSPMFSPDGRWIAFQAQDGKLKKVPLNGGAPISLASYNEGNGIAWSPNGVLVVGAGSKWLGLSTVAENGGALTPLTTPDTVGATRWHIWPVMLADGRSVVFSIFDQLDPKRESELAVTSLDDGVVHPIGLKGARALGATGDYLVYLTGDGVVMGTRFDLRKRRATGNAVALIDSIPMCSVCNGDAAVTLSTSGALVYMRGAPRGRLVWMKPDGTDVDVGPAAAVMSTPRLSPDGTKIAVAVNVNARSDIWIYQVATHTMSKLTTVGDNTDPEWFPDGRSVQFLSTRGGPIALWRQPVDFSGDAQQILPTGTARQWGAVVAPDAKYVMLQTTSGGTVKLLSVAIGADSAAQLFEGGDHNAWGARFSPSGRSVAYASDESGRAEVYIRSFPGPGARIQVSAAGGSEPVWSRDGLHLHYRVGNQMTRATLTPEPAISTVARDSLFSGPFFGPILSQSSYDVARDGRMLMIKPHDDHFQLVVSLNWTTELAARLGEP
jgi:serine/threonine-protein kinase